MASTCAGCQQKLPSRQYLTCSLCAKPYDLECANVSTQRFYNTMTLEHKKIWKCPACHCKIPKKGNSDTPVRSRDPEVQKRTNSEENITHRNKISTLTTTTSDSEDSSILGNTVCVEETNEVNCSLKTELTLQNLNDIIILRLKENNESIITGLQNTITFEINKAMTKLKEDITYDTNILYKQNDDRKLEIENINTKIEKLQKEFEILMKDLKLIESKLTHPKQQRTPESNTKKIVIYGLSENYREPDYVLHDRIVQMFRDIQCVDLQGYIEDTYRIGRRTNNNNSRPLVVELISKRMTRYIIENSIRFQGSGLNISEFLDENARKKRKNMQEEMIRARKRGLYAVIRNNSLYVEGKKVEAHTITETLRESTINYNYEHEVENKRNSSFRAINVHNNDYSVTNNNSSFRKY